MISYNKKLVPMAKVLRKNMTPEEKRLWYDFLKRLPYTVRRQHNIGNYIVDFYIAKKKVVIEVDGLQHTLTENREADAKRDSDLLARGITVLRYKNDDIRNHFEAVERDIIIRLGLNLNELRKPIE